MGKEIKKLFEKDLVIKIVSILIAILIWFLVLDKDNPFEERTLAVPLFSNIEVLQYNNIQIVGTQLPTSIDIKIKGRRQKIMAVTANDLSATIDFSGITESGTKRININTPKYLGDQDIIISGINPTAVSLNFERVVGKQYPVNVEYKGKLPTGYELVNIKVDPNNVILEEKESSISKVSKVVALINLDEIQDNKEIVLRGTVLDSKGQTLRQFDGKVPIIVSFDLAKRVPIVGMTKGEPAEDYYLKEIKYSIPSLRVLGSKSLLDSLIKINTEAIDITGQSASFKTPLIITPPKGATLLKEDTDLLSAEVVLARYATRSINIPSSSVSIYESDTTGTKEYKLSDAPIEITIKGKPEVINGVKGSDISLSINVNGLEQGEHVVALDIKLPNYVSLVGTYNVKVIIEAAPKDQPVTNPSDYNNP